MTELSIEPVESPAAEFSNLCEWVELSCADLESQLEGNPLAIRVMQLRYAAKKAKEVSK
jgi:hypothetical protein